MDRDINLEKSLAAKVRECREAFGWSQAELADVAGIEKKQVQRVEGAVGSPMLKTLTAIAKALGKQPWELLKVDYQVKVITNFEPGQKRLPGATTYVIKLVQTNFFNTPKTVKEVVEECEVRYDVSLKSSAVSGVLKTLVDERTLKGIDGQVRGRYLYQKAKKQ